MLSKVAPRGCDRPRSTRGVEPVTMRDRQPALNTLVRALDRTSGEVRNRTMISSCLGSY